MKMSRFLFVSGKLQQSSRSKPLANVCVVVYKCICIFYVLLKVYFCIFFSQLFTFFNVYFEGILIYLE